MASNTQIQIADLDFSSIKSNFINYLQKQDTFKDYNFTGSAMSVLLDVLAYNTQYNAYYLNMVANEMFLDSALQRSSVISSAKLLNYVPKSAIAPTATISLTLNGVASSSYTIPKFTNFMSEAIDSVNYNFVTTESVTVNTINNTATFNNVTIKQGIPVTYTYTVNSTTNPKYTFQLPDVNVDTTTIQVTVQKISTQTATTIFNPATNYLNLSSTDDVYFIEESLNGYYNVIFGDGILGSKLNDGAIVIISYIVTEGKAATYANNFTLMSSLGGFNSYTITPVIKASSGGDKETIDSIKFQAPKSYAAQNRAVTKNDYITAIQQNSLGFSFDAVNVWGGEQNDPPVYGQVFICLKPSGGYTLSNAQKQKLIGEVISPLSVLTIEPTIITPDYTFLNFDTTVYYNPSKTTLTASQLEANIIATIKQFAKDTLNTFNSSFNTYNFLTYIQQVDPSINNVNFDLTLEKRFFPVLNSSSNYKLYYSSELQRGILNSGVSSSPSYNLSTSSGTTNGIYIEEVPQNTFGIESISVNNPGFSYQYTPTVNIIGDGNGALAHAVIVNGSIQNIVVDSAGNNYTQAYATVTPQTNDTTGTGAVLTVNLQGRYGTLRSYFNSANTVKTIINSNVGQIDYSKGIIILNNFGVSGVDNYLGILSIKSKPVSTAISSTYNRIITLDENDVNAIKVHLIAQSS
jgi:hypothetical protein